MAQKGKLVFGALIIGAVIAAIVGYTMWNKPHADIRNQETDFTLKTLELINEFMEDKESASTKYTDKTVVMSGEVYQVDRGDSNVLVIFDQGLDYILNVELLEKQTELDKGKFVTLKAFFQGVIEGEPDFMLPGEIQFKKGIIIDNAK